MVCDDVLTLVTSSFNVVGMKTNSSKISLIRFQHARDLSSYRLASQATLGRGNYPQPCQQVDVAESAAI